MEGHPAPLAARYRQVILKSLDTPTEQPGTDHEPETADPAPGRHRTYGGL